MIASDPVSYTHLDVYKRQVQERRDDLGAGVIGIGHQHDGLVPDACDPVSYTHLDVYKRQAAGRYTGRAVSGDAALYLARAQTEVQCE